MTYESRRSQGSSSETRRHAHSRSSHHADGTARLGRATSASSSARLEYDPENDPHYQRVLRPDRDDYTRIQDIIAHPALSDLAPRPPRSGGHRARHPGPHHQYGTAASSYHSANTMSQSRGNNLHAGPLDQARSTLPYEPRQGRHQSQTSSFPHYLPNFDHTAPYDAIGFSREDGGVFDPEETFEEYRQSEHYEQHSSEGYGGYEQYGQDGQFAENESSEWYDVRPNGTY